MGFFQNKWLKQLLSTLCFLSLLVIILIYCNNHLQTTSIKYDSTDTPLADGCDVIFAGTSQTYYAINPVVLWEDYGIASYNFGSMAQYIGLTYYSLQDIFKHQTPSLLILDYESIKRPDDFLIKSNLLYSIPTIADISIRYNAYKDLINDGLPYFLPLLRYHNRYKELTKNDFVTINDHYNMGSGILTHIGYISQELPPVANESAEISPLGEKEQYYLDAILELAAKNNCQVLLVDYPGYDSNDFSPITNNIKQQASNKNVPILDFHKEQIYNSMKLDITDFADSMHLNIYGANKVSHYLGNYIKDNYSISLDSNVELQAQWNEKIAVSQQFIDSHLLRTITSYDEYMEALKKGPYTVITSYQGTTNKAPFCSIVKNGEAVFISHSPTYEFSYPLDSNDLLINGWTNTDDSGNITYRSGITYNKESKIKVTEGINILVYDNTRKMIVDNIGFDLTISQEGSR